MQGVCTAGTEKAISLSVQRVKIRTTGQARQSHRSDVLKTPGLIHGEVRDLGRMQKRELPRQSPRAQPGPAPRARLHLGQPAAGSTPGSPGLSFPPFFNLKIQMPEKCMCSFSESSVQKAAEWINGLKWLI